MNPLAQLSEHHQSYWIDNLSRAKIESGELKHRVATQHLSGVTSNPTIFDKAITGGPEYDEQIETLVIAGASIEQIYQELVTTDIRNACDILRPVYDQTRGKDGFVSLEISPHLAHDAEASIDAARHLNKLVERPNLFVKIPGTAAGVSAIEECLFEGININITLLFSIERYEAVAQAYIRALERRMEAGRPLDGVASVASFFLSRIDVLTDQLLSHHLHQGMQHPLDPDPRGLLGKSAVANAKLAYQSFKKIIQSDRWHALESRGARIQRLLWASTSTKNPNYDDLMYVEPLIGPHTVNTMPDNTIAAFSEHGKVATTIERGVEQARRTMADLANLGIDFHLVTEQLQNEGIQKFIEPYDGLMGTLESKRDMILSHHRVGPLQQMARKLRRQVIRMTTQAGSGHATSSMSCAEMITALFFHEMRWDPNDPDARDVDRFILSKGHAAPILWAVLAEAGALTEDPMSLRRFDSTLEGHPTPRNPWVKVATGSLGQGLSAANGIALANRLDGIDARVYCLLGDGECSEGSVWEAAQFAALKKIKNLVALVDVNGLAQSGPAPYLHDTSVLARRFQAFGWRTIEIDGHDMVAVVDALCSARKGGPTAIIARTEKGKGVSFLEGAYGWHGKALNTDQMNAALRELGTDDIKLHVEPRHLGGDPVEPQRPPKRIPVRYALGEEVATRKGYGNALCKLGTVAPNIVALDGDVKNSTYAEEFAGTHPNRFFEAYIAEQNMVGTAVGLAACGKIPYVSTFACFQSRAYDFIRMAGHSRPPHLIFCGSHAGVSIGEDGPSQMGLEDLAMFRAVIGSTVLYPCDAVSTERLTEQAANTKGIVYIRTTRPKTPVIYANDDDFPVGGSKTLRRSDSDLITLVGAGITVHEALAAHDLLKESGINTRVIDAYSIKPLDIGTLTNAARETRALVVVEDHWSEGGLGEAVAIGVQTAIHHLAITEEPRSGHATELMDHYGISRTAIVRKVLDILR